MLFLQNSLQGRPGHLVSTLGFATWAVGSFGEFLGSLLSPSHPVQVTQTLMLLRRLFQFAAFSFLVPLGAATNVCLMYQSCIRKDKVALLQLPMLILGAKEVFFRWPDWVLGVCVKPFWGREAVRTLLPWARIYFATAFTTMFSVMMRIRDVSLPASHALRQQENTEAKTTS